MRSITAAKPATTPIPVQLSEPKCTACEFQVSSDRSSSWFPLTQNLANKAIVSSTISLDFEIRIDATRLHHADAWQVGPRDLGSKPFNIRRDPIRPNLQPPVVGIHRFLTLIRDLATGVGFGILQKKRDVLIESCIFLFDLQDIIGLLLSERHAWTREGTDGFLGTHGARGRRLAPQPDVRSLDPDGCVVRHSVADTKGTKTGMGLRPQVGGGVCRAERNGKKLANVVQGGCMAS